MSIVKAKAEGEGSAESNAKAKNIISGKASGKGVPVQKIKNDGLGKELHRVYLKMVKDSYRDTEIDELVADHLWDLM